MAKDIGLVFSDTHTGSNVGCLPAEGAFLDDDNHIDRNKAQEWLGEQFDSLLGEVKAIYRKGDRVHSFLVGDINDAIKKSTQVWSRLDIDIIKATVKFLEPVRELTNGGLFFVRGTAAHTGPAGSLEEAVAMNLGATKWPLDSKTFSKYFLTVDIQGVRMNFAHHGSAGRLAWTRANPAGRIAAEAILEAAEHDCLPPHVVYRAHTHTSYDSHDMYGVRVIQLPCFQLATEYGHKVAPGKNCHIGGAVFTVEQGRFESHTYRYYPKDEPAWSPTVSLTPDSPSSSKPSKPRRPRATSPQA